MAAKAFPLTNENNGGCKPIGGLVTSEDKKHSAICSSGLPSSNSYSVGSTTDIQEELPGA
jgi:hypothetical protein